VRRRRLVRAPASSANLGPGYDVLAAALDLYLELEVAETGAGVAAAKSAPLQVHSSAELFEAMQGRTADAPMCFTCGTKMRPAGSCFVCEGCGSTSGCS